VRGRGELAPKRERDTMTRKDYQLIANAINELVSDFGKGETVAISLVADTLADALTATNPLFNRARFLTACGVN
jgi:hypothetical protein